ncbi:type II toxin-antitoxin system VapC family toxin [Inquilinus sp. NPDC058860]|uniref:type II toxin-antitoxin system VapC family toxin n=1 Tax=Inquilinus sp. NPDC058860 TaxID=3346652 RepID=UPI00368DFC1D
MILLDTNVVSEPLRPDGDPTVLAWLDAQTVETLYLSAISLAELRFGIAALPDGKRKDSLHAGLEQIIVSLFGERVLPFDAAASAAYAALRARARAAGRAIGTVDGFIAATAAAKGFAVATRDRGPFEAAGLDVINPWAWKGPQ